MFMPPRLIVKHSPLQKRMHRSQFFAAVSNSFVIRLDYSCVRRPPHMALSRLFTLAIHGMQTLISITTMRINDSFMRGPVVGFPWRGRWSCAMVREVLTAAAVVSLELRVVPLA